MAGKGGRGKISYVQQDEPNFIRKFKQKVGYKEGPTVDTKREELDLSDGDNVEGEDEKPVVVVLRDGDLTAEEAERLQAATTTNEDDEPPADGKIIFKKPVKRNIEGGDSESKQSADTGIQKPKKKKSSKHVKKTSLLSFEEDENDDG